MKKSILLVILLVIMSMTAFADGPRFDHMRSVLIVNTTRQDEVTNYMTHRLMQPFRIPYWDRLQSEDCLSPQDITEDKLRTLAETYHADVVLVPVVRTWQWRQYTLFFHYDDELITEYAYYFTVYAYDSQKGTFKRYSSRGFDRESASILNNPYDILSQAMDQIMEKLPYKRIPTDIEGIRGSLTDLPTKTTADGAVILTPTPNMAI